MGLKIGFIYGIYCLGSEANAFDFNNLWGDPRGLTGSELSFLQYARELKKLGHDVSIFTVSKSGYDKPWGEVPIRPINDLLNLESGWDCFCSWNEADVMRAIPPDCLRLVNLQINDFAHCQPGFDQFVDVWTSPSKAHRDRMISTTFDSIDASYKYAPPSDRWEVLCNGVMPDGYDKSIERVPGRVIWASSPDRGLHWLLRCWPKISRAVPEAHLKIFYKLRPWLDSLTGREDHFAKYHISVRESAQRARYIDEALRRLNGHSIEVIGSISRNQIDIEMAEAQVLAYPCDTLNWTEGFSVTLMEACASGVVPITTDVDALGSIYGEAVPMVKSPVGDRLDEFGDLVIRALTDSNYRQEVINKTTLLATKYRWSDLAKELNRIITSRLNAK
jgi:glycosyltransferase involved in cell wall biosynthesis